MIVQGTPGPVATTASLPPGGPQTLRLGNMQDLVVTELHGRYYEAGYRKTLFGGATQGVAALALPAGLTTTYTGGLVLSNPYGNTYNLVLNKVAYGFIIVQTNPAVIGLMVGQSPTALSGTLTSVTPTSNNIGSGATPTGQLYCTTASITLPATPTLKLVLGAVDTGITTSGVNGGPATTDIEGGIILPPGAFAAIYSSAAGTASSFFGSMQWEEVPV